MIRRLHLRAVALAPGLALAAHAAAAQHIESPLLHRAAAGAVRHELEHTGAPASPSSRASRSFRALQFLAATAGAIAGGSAGYSIMRDPARDRVKGDAGYSRAGNMGYAIGSAVGATVVGYAIGRTDGSHGSLAVTAIGASLPALPMVASVNDPYAMFAAVVLMTPLEGLGATLGYQRTRRP